MPKTAKKSKTTEKALTHLEHQKPTRSLHEIKDFRVISDNWNLENIDADLRDIAAEEMRLQKAAIAYLKDDVEAKAYFGYDMDGVQRCARYLASLEPELKAKEKAIKFLSQHQSKVYSSDPVENKSNSAYATKTV